jgi:hypothetical protein
MVATVRRSRDLRLSNLRPAMLTALALVIPAALLAAVGAREVDDLYVTHMVAVGATMLVAVVAAILLTRAGTRSGDVRAVRILTVCDVYDAPVSERVYRAAMPEHEALAILDAERGTAFDPGCVDGLRTLLGSTALAAA